MNEGLFKDLPPPPPGKTGWPWTVESKPLPPTMQDGNPWPKISIVTPSYNQGQFLEETIRSVLLQNYPNLEYIIMDGGSSDNSVEIIKKYEPWLTYWVSEKDKGQADAIYRGFERTTGEILAWINSDDYYMQNAFSDVAPAFVDSPQSEMLVGGYVAVRENGRAICKFYSYTQKFEELLCSRQLFGQMACFWRRQAFFEAGGFDRHLAFCFDYDLFLNLTKRRAPVGLRKILAAYRVHPTTKSSTIWETVGRKEMNFCQERHGIASIPEAMRTRIAQKATAKAERLNRAGLLLDAFFDTPFFVKSCICRLRDFIILDRFRGRK